MRWFKKKVVIPESTSNVEVWVNIPYDLNTIPGSNITFSLDNPTMLLLSGDILVEAVPKLKLLAGPVRLRLKGNLSLVSAESGWDT